MRLKLFAFASCIKQKCLSFYVSPHASSRALTLMCALVRLTLVQSSVTLHIRVNTLKKLRSTSTAIIVVVGHHPFYPLEVFSEQFPKMYNMHLHFQVPDITVCIIVCLLFALSLKKNTRRIDCVPK